MIENIRKPYPVFDGHSDVLFSQYMEDHPRSLFDVNDQGHVDFPRAKRGGLKGGVFAIFIPHPDFEITSESLLSKQGAHKLPSFLMDRIDASYAKKITLKAFDTISSIKENSKGRVQVALCVEDIYQGIKADVFSMVIHLEGAEAIHPDLDALDEFYEKGLRSVGLVWSRENVFGEGVKFAFPGKPDTGPGLTEQGRALIGRCNEMGILIDLSHLNEKGFWDVHGISDKPIIASHSCVHAISPSSRNLTDQQLDAIGESNGIVGINFSVEFIREDGQREKDTPLHLMVRHFKYIADRIGVDHVAIGSDFDGATISNAIGDVTGLPDLVEALFDGGFHEDEVQKILFGNWMRVFKETWKK